MTPVHDKLSHVCQALNQMSANLFAALTETASRRSSPGSSGPILEAVVFDLDGVLTDTASLHLAAWQRLFNEVYARHPSAAAFTEADYLHYVDGRRRTDGVTAVLTSRGIEVPAGEPDDPADRETVAGLAQRKDDYYWSSCTSEARGRSRRRSRWCGRSVARGSTLPMRCTLSHCLGFDRHIMFDATRRPEILGKACS